MSNKAYRIIVTRPKKQGRELVQTLNQHGFKAINTPFFEYRANASLEKYHQLLSPLPEIIIFVSVAAVEFANRTLPLIQWPKTTWLAVGEATCNKIKSYGIESVLHPTVQTSEGLLSLPDLQNPTNKHILIVRGNSGREHMAQQLTVRGATVQYLEAYQRHWFDLTQETVQQWQREHFNCITITSNDLLESVVQLINNQTDRNQKAFWLNTCLWIVASERIASRAFALGLKHIICSDGASDKAILTALRKMERDHDR